MVDLVEEPGLGLCTYRVMCGVECLEDDPRLLMAQAIYEEAPGITHIDTTSEPDSVFVTARVSWQQTAKEAFRGRLQVIADRQLQQLLATASDSCQA